MFAGSSEINISVIVKHEQQIRIIRAFFLPGATFFLSPRYFLSSTSGTEKIAVLNCWARVISTQADTMVYIYIYIYTYIHIYWFAYWEGWAGGGEAPPTS